MRRGVIDRSAPRPDGREASKGRNRQNKVSYFYRHVQAILEENCHIVAQLGPDAPLFVHVVCERRVGDIQHL